MPTSLHTFPELLPRFFAEHLTTQRNLSPHTIAAYHDCFRLLLRFLSAHLRVTIDRLTLESLTPDTILAFLAHLEDSRKNVPRTRNSRLAAIRAFAEPGALQKRYAHPMGNIRGRTVIGFRISDSLVHGWDLAKALGEEVILDPELCEYCLDFWFPMAATLPSSGFYKDAKMPPEDADVATRLLSFLGREV